MKKELSISLKDTKKVKDLLNEYCVSAVWLIEAYATHDGKEHRGPVIEKVENNNIEIFLKRYLAIINCHVFINTPIEEVEKFSKDKDLWHNKVVGFNCKNYLSRCAKENKKPVSFICCFDERINNVRITTS